jgi:mannose-6-phosphate isomerase-like protein (cupin superfamily)
MNRRRFISIGAAIGAAAIADPPLRATQQSSANAESAPKTTRKPILVRAGMSRRVDGTEAPKAVQQTMVRSFDSEGRMAALVVPPIPAESWRGAPLHVHHDVDEWLCVLAGEFVAEVGGKRMRLKLGDSLLMPREIPHRWSFGGVAGSGILHIYTPAGRMDVNFDSPAPPPGTKRTPEDIKASFDDFNMTLLGDPLTKEEIAQTV